MPVPCKPKSWEPKSSSTTITICGKYLSFVGEEEEDASTTTGRSVAESTKKSETDNNNNNDTLVVAAVAALLQLSTKASLLIQRIIAIYGGLLCEDNGKERKKIRFFAKVWGKDLP